MNNESLIDLQIKQTIAEYLTESDTMIDTTLSREEMVQWIMENNNTTTLAANS
jgi:hypothetical protein